MQTDFWVVMVLHDCELFYQSYDTTALFIFDSEETAYFKFLELMIEADLFSKWK